MTAATKSHLITQYERAPKKEDPSWGLIAFSLVVTIAVSAWYAFVTWKLYGWFVVPLGAPAINWWHMWGLLTFVNLLIVTLRPSPDEDKGLKVALKTVLTRSIVIATMLLLGWIISGQIS